MIEQTNINREHDILGMRLNVQNEAEQESVVTSSRVIEFVQEQVDKLKEQYPHLDNAQLAVLLAMNIARERLELEAEFKANIEDIERSTKSALENIESITPLYN
jgi:cell division protein ZapA (FtsZ GTPase activity inhibitor)